MQSSAPRSNEPALWSIHGSIPRARITWQYRVATALVAVAMVLLPVVYLGMIGALGWWLWDYAAAGPINTGRRQSGMWVILTYLTPLLVGGLVLLFMIKPLFHRRSRAAEPHRLSRETEPQLFAFIDRICDLVHAPRPHRVLVDLQVNASAGLTHGVWSILSRRLTLTIGLPLAGGLSAREFGGVLAHEFGHFAQGAGMGTTYIVRMISMWFARVVYERDQWDAALETWARESDWRVMIVLQIARFTVWLVRRILWVLMIIGSFFSAVLMRQMEFDADHYEIQTSGSTGFIATARRLRLLGLGAHVTNNKQEEAFNAKRLVDDIPGWILHETARLPRDVCEKVLSAAVDEKTKWLDTHPSDRQRMDRATAASADGVLRGDDPARALFTDFAGLARTVTANVYRDLADAIRRKVSILPLAQMTAESDAESQGGEAMNTLFHGLLTPHTMIFLSPRELLEPGLDDPRAASLAAREKPEDAQLAAAKELDEARDRQNEMHGVLGLFEAGIPVNVGLHKLPHASPSAASKEGLRAAQRLESASALAAPVLARSRRRLVAGLQWKLQRAEPELRTELLSLAATLERIEHIAPTLNAMRPLAMGMTAILNNHEQATDNAAFRAASTRADQLRQHNEKLLLALGDLRYPFAHGGSAVTLREYLTDSVAHPDGMVLAWLRAETIQERLLGVYARAIGRLALLTVQAEAEMETAPELA